MINSSRLLKRVMNRPARSVHDRFEDPLPGGQFKSFMLFWHVFLLGGLALTLGISIWDHGGPLGGRELTLAGFAGVQAVVYWLSFCPPREQSGWRWLAYFSVSLLCLAGEVALDPRFGWLVGAYAGQMLGALPPKASLPAVALVLGGFAWWRLDWRFVSTLSPILWICAAGMILSWIVLALFLHHLAAASSDRARLIRELRAAKQELELNGARDAELAALRERERLARDLHDSLGHALVTLTVQAEAAQRLMAVDPPRAQGVLEETKLLARSSMESLRAALANLRATGLGHRPLSEALAGLCKDAHRQIAMECEVPIEADQLNPIVAEVLWRVAEEAMLNLKRHAQASSGRLRLAFQPETIILWIEDDGVGFPLEAEQRPGHYGLRGMRERIEGLGGVLTLRNRQPRGAVVEARIPRLA